jgi:hypothetical protein
MPGERIDGPSGSLTLSYRVSPNTEWSLGPGYSYIGGQGGWDGSAGLALRLVKGLWLDGGYWIGQVKHGWSVGLRTDFGGN